MSARRVAWLLVAAVLVIAFAVWVSSLRHLERSTTAGDSVLPGLERGVNTVTQVQLRKGNGTQATLTKGNSGWLVAERGWPAETGRVRKLLLDLGALNVVEEKTRLPANYPQLGVEDVTGPKATGTLIEVTAAPRTWALIVGKSSDAKAGYVRRVNAPQSLLAAPLLSVDADPKSWLEHALLDVRAERVREVAVQPAGGPAYTASRAKKEDPHYSVSPLPKGRELAGPGAADALGAALSGLTLDDVAKATQPRAQGGSRATFRTFDGLEIELVGRKDGTRSLITVSARSSDGQASPEAQPLSARLDGFEFEIPDYKYAALFTPLNELLKPLPEPAKKGGREPKAPQLPKSPPAARP
jgi:hypothetical protein